MSSNRQIGKKATSEEYIFHYNLDPDLEKNECRDHLGEFVKEILQNLLDIIVPLKEGKDVKIDGFRWLMNKERNYEIFPRSPEQAKATPHRERVVYQDTRNVAFYEPRISFVSKLLELLLSLIELEKDGRTIEANGFRLRNLSHWLVPSSGDPREIFEYAGSHCDCNCIFCYNKGNPASLAKSGSSIICLTKYTIMIGLAISLLNLSIFESERSFST